MEILNMIIDCIREGLDDVFYVFLINDEVNIYNLKMLMDKCNDLKEINVKDY